MTLTSEKMLIGAISSVWLGCWLLPQIFAGNYLIHMPRKFPFMMKCELIGRSLFPLFTLWLLFMGVRFQSLTLAFFFFMLAYFMVFDAIVSVAWSDLMGKAIPPERRGRILGLARATNGALSIGAGFGIRYLLSPQGPAYPTNFAIIFGLASLCFWGSLGSCALIKEPHEETVQTRPSWRNYAGQLARLVVKDRLFSRVTLARVLVGLGGLSASFYVVYATDVIHLPMSTVGWFASASTVGGALSGLVLGALSERRGNHTVVKLTTWMAFGAPALGLAIHLGIFDGLIPWIFPLIFFCMGFTDGGMFLGFYNYVLEIAPAGERPTYIGLTNTLTGVNILVPILGGFLLERTSFPLLFGLTAVGLLGAVVVAARLPNPREVLTLTLSHSEREEA